MIWIILIILVVVFYAAVTTGEDESAETYEWLVVYKDAYGGLYKQVLIMDTNVLDVNLISTIEAKLSADFDHPCVINILLLDKSNEAENLNEFEA